MPMLLAPVALLGLAVWAAWTVTRQSAMTPIPTSRSNAAPVGMRVPAPRNGAEALAHSRLARGEITAEECSRIISILRQ